MKVKQDTSSRYGTVFVPIEISMLLTVGDSNSRYDAAKNLIKPAITHEKYCNTMWMHRKLELKTVSFIAIKQKNRFSETGFLYQVPCLPALPADSSVLGSFRHTPTFAPADPLLSRYSLWNLTTYQVLIALSISPTPAMMSSNDGGLPYTIPMLTIFS